MGKAVKGTAKFKTLKEEQELDIRYEKYKSINCGAYNHE